MGKVLVWEYGAPRPVFAGGCPLDNVFAIELAYMWTNRHLAGSKALRLGQYLCKATMLWTQALMMTINDCDQPPPAYPGSKRLILAFCRFFYMLVYVGRIWGLLFPHAGCTMLKTHRICVDGSSTVVVSSSASKHTRHQLLYVVTIRPYKKQSPSLSSDNRAPVCRRVLVPLQRQLLAGDKPLVHTICTNSHSTHNTT